ncbi:MAG: hypothetical protein GY861_16270 [bacterium]|nr:hypothetical protein [bacterium]
MVPETITATVIDFGITNPNDLFVKGPGKEEFYFISEPILRAERGYYEQIRNAFEKGEPVQIEIMPTEKREAELVLPFDLEVETMGKYDFFDTVDAKLVPADLFSIIHPLKEAQINRFHKNNSPSYEQAMKGLEEGKAQQRLEGDRIAREIVRAVMGIDNSATIEGKNGYSTIIVGHPRVIFPAIRDSDILDVAIALKDEDGLLDGFAEMDWCLQTEQVLYGPDENSAALHKIRFEPNQQLRETLQDMLEPFNAERPIFRTELGVIPYSP